MLCELFLTALQTLRPYTLYFPTQKKKDCEVVVLTLYLFKLFNGWKDGALCCMKAEENWEINCRFK
jgi:hypothetical protein